MRGDCRGQDGRNVLGGGLGDGQEVSGHQHLQWERRGSRGSSSCRLRICTAPAPRCACRLTRVRGSVGMLGLQAQTAGRPPTLSVMYSSDPHAEMGSPSTLATWPTASVMVYLPVLLSAPTCRKWVKSARALKNPKPRMRLGQARAGDPAVHAQDAAGPFECRQVRRAQETEQRRKQAELLPTWRCG